MDFSIVNRLYPGSPDPGQAADRPAGPGQGTGIGAEQHRAPDGPGGGRQRRFHLYWDRRHRILLRTR